MWMSLSQLWSKNSQRAAMLTGFKGSSHCGWCHKVNVRNKSLKGPTPPANKAKVLTRHLQPHRPCYSSSFHHFHSPMMLLFLHNHTGVGHSIRVVAFGSILPFRLSEWNSNEMWEAFIIITTAEARHFPSLRLGVSKKVDLLNCFTSLH